MKTWLTLIVLLQSARLLAAADPAWLSVSAGALQGGFVKRSTDELQTYFYAQVNGVRRLVKNHLDVVAKVEDVFVNFGPGAAAVDASGNLIDTSACGVDTDCVQAHFTLVPDGIEYTLTVNNVIMKPGKLTGVFGQPAQAQLDPLILVPCTTQKVTTKDFAFSHNVPDGMGRNQTNDISGMVPWSVGKYNCLRYYRGTSPQSCCTLVRP